MITYSEAREAFSLFLDKTNQTGILGEEDFWRFLGTSMREMDDLNPRAARKAYGPITAPEVVAQRIRMLNGPHRDTLFQAMAILKKV